jgi:hypothetical protein
MKPEQPNEPRAVEAAPSPRGSQSSAQDPSVAAPSCRILITPEASSSLDEALARVTKDFDGGRIGRTQLASWLLQNASQRLSDSDVDKIHAVFFDRVAYLEALLRRAKETGTCPPEIDALFDSRAGASSSKKRVA